MTLEELEQMIPEEERKRIIKELVQEIFPDLPRMLEEE